MDIAGILSKEVSVFSLATMIFSQPQSAIWLIWKNYLIYSTLKVKNDHVYFTSYSTLFLGSCPTRPRESERTLGTKLILFWHT